MNSKQSLTQSLLNKIHSLGTETYVRQPDLVKTVDPSKISDALYQLESSRGIDPNTPRNRSRSYTIPGANQNEQPRNIDYQTGYAGQFGLTPNALAQLAKSTVDKTSPQNKKGYTDFTPGMSPRDIQKALLTSTTSAGLLAKQHFINQKASSTDFTPTTLTSDYMENYVTKASPNYNDANRQRVFSVFNNLSQ